MHIYECPDGKKVPSVTTILQIIGNKEIIYWANRLGFKHIDYETELNRLADNGTLMHTVLQHIVDPSLANEPIVFKDKFEEEKYLKLAEKFSNMIKNYSYTTIFTEKTFISSKLGYGGTVDWFADMNGFNMINDFKSSKRVYMKQLLQIGGYYNLMIENGYSISGGSIILVNERIATLYPINELSLIRLGEIFNYIYFVYQNIIDEMIPYDNELLEKLKARQELQQ